MSVRATAQHSTASWMAYRHLPRQQGSGLELPASTVASNFCLGRAVCLFSHGFGALPDASSASLLCATHSGMTLANMSITLGLIPFAAHLADKGLPRLAATAGVLIVAALASVPMLLAISSKSLVAAWLMQVGAPLLQAQLIERCTAVLAVP